MADTKQPQKGAGVTVSHRVRCGYRVKRAYHDECDDRSAHGEGHMQVVKNDGGYVYRCLTCGHTVPYDSLDTSQTAVRAR